MVRSEDPRPQRPGSQLVVFSRYSVAGKAKTRLIPALGLLRTTLRNQCIIAAFLAGVSPERLAHWYREPGPGGGKRQ